ncbi:menaquinone biosynthetic enzyme MqnA/MqnD family protein [Stratiformator vulcanicus]|uniref:menaquinone biosynthetic enzyme MqnA/MqnD family protein n=1 Tax=Stratiformator vulcanicus TaxID=2527980 RepID=UPI0011A6B13F|nr:menaquinone biosynthesis protein [Stratiformator vulcanicus]
MKSSNRPHRRIAAVSYLNSKPLIAGLSAALAPDKFSVDVPSRLADDLVRSNLDVALVPTVEVLRHPGHEIISDACVSARGPVRSVKLYCRVSPGEVKSLALDEGSRTSATLTRLILLEKYGVRPTAEPLPLSHSTADTTADAVLLIGDRAMFPPEEHFHTVWDLGQHWYDWTGLPFVFAVWAARSGVMTEDIDRKLREARDRGVEAIDEISAREAPLLGLSVDSAIDYLRHNLHFTLGDAERAGLKLFRQLCTDAGLLPQGEDIVFRHHDHSRQSDRRRAALTG